MMEQIDSNIVKVIGVVSGECEFSHDVYGEKFYIFYIKTKRLSEFCDVLPIIISERLLSSREPQVGEKVQVFGQIRSYNELKDNKNKLILTVFAKQIDLGVEGEADLNTIFLDGFVCKKPVFRVTPFGREICDILLAVNRSFSKSDYIPLIAWGRNAKFASDFEVGMQIKIWGRIQARAYMKKLTTENKDIIEERVAYEVSVSKLEKFL